MRWTGYVLDHETWCFVRVLVHFVCWFSMAAWAYLEDKDGCCLHILNGLWPGRARDAVDGLKGVWCQGQLVLRYGAVPRVADDVDGGLDLCVDVCRWGLGVQRSLGQHVQCREGDTGLAAHTGARVAARDEDAVVAEGDLRACASP